MRKKIKCRYCAWQRHAWITLRSGKRQSNYMKLVRHVFDDHPEKFAEVMKRISVLDDELADELLRADWPVSERP